ncbi:MAG: hypothetical protein ACP5IB_08645 [Thermoplasmata archaeon]
MPPDNAFSDTNNQKGMINHSEPLSSKKPRDGGIFKTGNTEKRTIIAFM